VAPRNVGLLAVDAIYMMKAIASSSDKPVSYTVPVARKQRPASLS